MQKNRPLKSLYYLFFGFFVFVTFEAIIFRSPIYRKIIHPSSSFGVFWNSIKFEESRPSIGLREILFVGDSRIAEGFSATRADQLSISKRIKWVNAGVSGSTLRNWYYYLREVDPKASRYTAILLPFEDFSDEGGESDLEGRYFLDLHIMTTVLKLTDIPLLIADAPTPRWKLKALRELLFKGFVFRSDVQDLLTSIPKRYNTVLAQNKDGATSFNLYDGAPFSLSGLITNASMTELKSPLVLSPAIVTGMENRLKVIPHSKLTSLAHYRAKWLGIIHSHYAHSNTRLIAVRIPVNPLGKALARPNGRSGILAELEKSEAITLLPGNFALRLETPDHFFDSLHLNHTGRLKFTREVVQQVSALIEPAIKGKENVVSFR